MVKERIEQSEELLRRQQRELAASVLVAYLGEAGHERGAQLAALGEAGCEPLDAAAPFALGLTGSAAIGCEGGGRMRKQLKQQGVQRARVLL